MQMYAVLPTADIQPNIADTPRLAPYTPPLSTVRKVRRRPGGGTVRSWSAVVSIAYNMVHLNEFRFLIYIIDMEVVTC